jgi:DHA1 family bicyclomycin/chloramphenicol resistance-like MFS transporter
VLAGVLLTPQSGPFPLLWLMFLSSGAGVLSTLYLIRLGGDPGEAE